ncbi:MAG: exodeoxyribonuclease III [Candidatus Hydrogenedentota bacterium]
MTTLYSWNVNGLRAVLKNGFRDWLHATRPDICCLQEIRVHPEDLPQEQRAPENWHAYWNPAAKKGYSGTAVLSREPAREVENVSTKVIGDEGRLQMLTFPTFTLLNGYWPNSQDDRKRLDYKLRFVRALTRIANGLVRDGRHVVLCGDFNIAHTEIDLARPKQNENSAGYYIEEREAMTRFLKNGYVDTFRHFCKEPGHYTWWSYRGGARSRNVGWRLDYFCVNHDCLPRVRRSWILAEVQGSDHCPIALEME